MRSSAQTVAGVADGGPPCPRNLPQRAARAPLAGADVVLVSDYGAGTTHAGPVRDALAHAARTGTLVWDPHPRGGAPVPGTALVTPNLAEALDAAEALGVDATPDDPGGLARSLAAAWDVGAVCVTAGERGAFVARADGEPA